MKNEIESYIFFSNTGKQFYSYTYQMLFKSQTDIYLTRKHISSKRNNNVKVFFLYSRISVFKI